ncbi:MAG TPA: hypothetical protein VJN96_21935 [Vicinamibacterales bacterium]|nr:hypothetical protein [Vicinamibacterales bacterium]
MTGSGASTSARTWLVAGLAVGALLRALALPLSGTGDVLTWKIWSYSATHDVTQVYGVGGDPPVHRELRWRTASTTVDYPPVVLGELALAGRLYRSFSPDFDDSRWLTACVKLPGVVFEAGFVALLLTRGRRWLGEAASWAALAFWLNPLVILNGPVLGYLDAEMTVPLVLALVCAWSKRPAATGVLTALAILTKAQAVFVVPAIVITLVARDARLRALVAAVASGTITGIVVISPFVIRGAGRNLAQAVGRLATHDMLSGQAANIWWIVTWVLRVAAAWTEWGARRALTQIIDILAISRAVELGYPNARSVGLTLVAIAIAWGCWRMRHLTRLAEAAALAAWCAYAYAMLAAQVHENHWYPAVPLLVLAAAADRRYRGMLAAVSVIAALNLYLFYGLGADWPAVTHRT